MRFDERSLGHLLSQVEVREVVFVQALSVCGCAAASFVSTSGAHAQNLTLEGQTGGFITPTAYVVYTAKDQFFSHPAVGYHFVNASNVIGNIHTFSITEGFANRAEVGYTRSVHQLGNSAAFSSLWDYPGMNIFQRQGCGCEGRTVWALDAWRGRGLCGAHERQVRERRA